MASSATIPRASSSVMRSLCSITLVACSSVFSQTSAAATAAGSSAAAGRAAASSSSAVSTAARGGASGEDAAVCGVGGGGGGTHKHSFRSTVRTSNKDKCRHTVEPLNMNMCTKKPIEKNNHARRDFENECSSSFLLFEQRDERDRAWHDLTVEHYEVLASCCCVYKRRYADEDRK